MRKPWRKTVSVKWNDITPRHFYPIKWHKVILLSNQNSCFFWRQKARAREVLYGKFSIFSQTKCWILDLCCSRVMKDKNENQNTLQKTRQDISVFKSFLELFYPRTRGIFAWRAQSTLEGIHSLRKKQEQTSSPRLFALL